MAQNVRRVLAAFNASSRNCVTGSSIAVVASPAQGAGNCERDGIHAKDDTAHWEPSC